MKEMDLENTSLKNLNLSDNFKNFLTNNLNFDQLIAVINLEKNLLVIAGAGSGKTRVIIYRAILLIELKISSKNILILTFTRKAITEIKTRINTFLPESNICIETFHSLAYKFLKKYAQNKNFKILTTKDSTSVFYEKSENIYSFNDLLIQFYKLLTSNLVTTKFQYIMVDEYQDTDDLQVDILKLLSKSSNLMVVGDDYQSIYSFKGTSMKNILNFSDEFSDVKTIILKENYRSSPAILNLSNEFSKSLKYCFRKSLITNNTAIEKPNLNIFRNHSDEVSFIFNKIKNILILNPNATIALLFRNYIYNGGIYQIF